jgi:hypothetical protein
LLHEKVPASSDADAGNAQPVIRVTLRENGGRPSKRDGSGSGHILQEFTSSDVTSIVHKASIAKGRADQTKKSI